MEEVYRDCPIGYDHAEYRACMHTVSAIWLWPTVLVYNNLCLGRVTSVFQHCICPLKTSHLKLLSLPHKATSVRTIPSVTSPRGAVSYLTGSTHESLTAILQAVHYVGVEYGIAHHPFLDSISLSTYPRLSRLRRTNTWTAQLVKIKY